MSASLPIGPAPRARPRPTDTVLPRGACDAHIHVLADDAAFPLSASRSEDPAPGTLNDWLTGYRLHMRTLGFDRTVIVQSLLYGDDNRITLEAARRLGRNVARTIVLVRDDVSDDTLDALADAGASGVRLNYVHGGILSWEGARALAPRLADRGLHIQMLMNAHLHLAEIAGDVRKLPVPVVFDHIGWPDLAQGIDEPGFALLLRMVAEGDAYVKLSGAYRVCDAPYDDAAEATRALAEANPERCLWGSDWPHIMLGPASMPDAGDLLASFCDAVTDVKLRTRILVDTPAKLYGFEQ